MNLGDDPSIAVRLSVPPWPSAEPDQSSLGMPIEGLSSDSLKHVYLTDAMRVGSSYQYSASDGVVAKVTAHGKRIREARARAYRTVDRITLPDKQFRSDIGDRASDSIDLLKSWKWL